jgi:hypothetical protein
MYTIKSICGIKDGNLQSNTSYDKSKPAEKWRRKTIGANVELFYDHDASQLPNTTEAPVYSV